ncbi:hypothetical protein hp908_0927 [Helicobacter pylori 908]|nr:hypothetical protein hp908_0927 [Helicobacter pylori 908]ADZ51603.1 hypothetical protein hp2018_0899 [Helicobacter pylori 2018]
MLRLGFERTLFNPNALKTTQNIYQMLSNIEINPQERFIKKLALTKSLTLKAY